jgi:hypothetical protein
VGKTHEAVHDAKTAQNILQEGNFAFLDNQLFFGKPIKFSEQ